MYAICEMGHIQVNQPITILLGDESGRNHWYRDRDTLEKLYMLTALTVVIIVPKPDLQDKISVGPSLKGLETCIHNLIRLGVFLK